MLSALMLSFGNAEEPKRAKVLSKEGNYIAISPMIGARILPDGSDEAIDLRPQGVESYYDSQLAKGISFKSGIVDTLQQDLAIDIDVERMELGAKETFVAVMHNRTGELLMLTRTSKFDPIYIKTKEIPVLKDRFADFLFEPGTLMIPIWATVMAEQKGVEKMAKELKETGDTSDLASFLNAKNMIKGLNTFGFGRPSGIDLPYDDAGHIPSQAELKSEDSRLHLLEGNELKVTFIQMLKAYSAFSANGLLLTPRIASSTTENNVTKKLSSSATRAFSKELSSKLKRGLINKAKRRNDILMMVSIDIGGAYSTNDLYKDGNATDEAYSTYYGFAENLLGQSYTIGVFMIYDKNKHTKDAPSPMSIFNLVVEKMVKEKILIVNDKYLNQNAMSPMPKGEIAEYFSEQIERVPECLDNTKRGISIECQYTTYRAPEDGAFVHAVLDGKVTFIGRSEKHGKVVIIRHKNKLDSMYLNLEYIIPTIKEGVQLKKGYRIGRVNETLRFQLTKDGVRVDPLEYLEL